MFVFFYYCYSGTILWTVLSVARFYSNNVYKQHFQALCPAHICSIELCWCTNQFLVYFLATWSSLCFLSVWESCVQDTVIFGLFLLYCVTAQNISYWLSFNYIFFLKYFFMFDLVHNGTHESFYFRIRTHFIQPGMHFVNI